MNNHKENEYTIDQLLKRSWTFKNSEEFVKFFTFIAKFKHYSRYNTMLVYIQNSEITFFGGISYWKKKFDREVNCNAKPYIILAPNGPIMFVYDIMDTEGKESPEDFLKKGLGRHVNEVKGKLEKRIYNKVLNQAEMLNIKIFTKPLSYFKGAYVTNIYSGKLEICLKQGMSREENFSVLIHELAHLFLGHTGHKELIYQGKKKPIKLLNRKLSKGVKELEAETVSYLISSKLGLETYSIEYLSAYIKDKDTLLQFDYDTVIKITDKIEGVFIK